MLRDIFNKKKSYGKLFCLCLVFFIGISISFLMLTQVKAASSELRVSGNKIYNSYDEIVRLTGVNICSMEWNPGGENILQSTVQALEHWNANVIRVPLNQEFWFGYNGSSTKNEQLATNYKNLLANVVKLAASRNKYVILDLHWSDNGGHGLNVGQQPMPNDYSVDFWREVCAIYGNNPSVIFGLYNEPFNVSWDVWQNGGSVTHNGITFHTPGFQRLVEAIRDTGAKNICIIGGLDWGYDLTGVRSHPIIDRNTAGTLVGNGIMYDAHVYPWKQNWDSLVSCIKDLYPVLIGECGWDDPDWAREQWGPNWHSEPHTTWCPKLLDWMDTNQYHWTAWSFHPGAQPILISDWNYTPSATWGVYAKPRLLSYDTGIVPDKEYGNLVPQSQITVTSDNQQLGNEAWKAIDGNSDTFWHSSWSPYKPIPASIILNLGNAYDVYEIRYLPRQDQGNSPNGAITKYNVFVSKDGTSFIKVVDQGEWLFNADEKSVTFSPVNARYVRLEALDGSLGFAGAAEINVGYKKYVPQSQMTATADNEQPGDGAWKAIDGNDDTFWHSSWNPSIPLPASITLNLGNRYNVNEIRYLPRQDQGDTPNGAISKFNVYVSTDGTKFKKLVNQGEWTVSKAEKSVTFDPMSARYVKLEVLNGFNSLGVAAEINIGYIDELIPKPTSIPTPTPVPLSTANFLPQSLMTAVSDNEQPGSEAGKVIDGKRDTFWTSSWNPYASFSATITINLGNIYDVNEIRYLPRQDQGNMPNGAITKYNLYVSTDGTNFTKIVNQGEWALNAAEKLVTFSPISAKYVKLEALEGYFNLAGAAEINVGCKNFVPQSQMSATASSEQNNANSTEGPCSNAIDGNKNTFWHSSWSPYIPLPAFITLNLGDTYDITLLKYLPRQDQADMPNGAIIKYNLYVSIDGLNFTKVVDQGEWALSEIEKSVTFNAINARYVRLEALEGYKDLAVAAEINVGYVSQSTPGPTPTPRPTPTPIHDQVPQWQMTAISDNEQPGDGAWKAIDGNSGSFWHSSWSPYISLPASITLNLGNTYNVNKMIYLPRQDQGPDAPNGAITKYNLYVSVDGTNFTKVIDQGIWALNAAEKFISFSAVSARYIKLEALEGYKNLAVAAEINVGYTSQPIPTPTPTPNAAPVFKPIGDLNVNEGQQLSFDVTAEDANGDALTYSALSMPPGATFDTASGSFTWIPGYDQAGNYTVLFEASDGNLTGSKEVAITVKNEPAQKLVTSLIKNIKDLNINRNAKNLLVKELEKVTTSLNKEQYKLAMVKMKVFGTSVKLLEPKTITKVQAKAILKACRDIDTAIQADAQGKKDCS